SPWPDATVLPSVLWSLLCSALLVGMMVTGDIIRAYSRQRLAGQEHGTGAFGASRSTDEPHGLQRARAGEPGRGRHAQAPWHIPWKGWKDIFWPPISKSERTACSQSLPEWCSTVYWPCSRPLPRWSLYTGCSQVRR